MNEHSCSPASSPAVEGLTGTYWSGLERPQLTPAANDDDEARRLWELSLSLAAIDDPTN